MWRAIVLTFLIALAGPLAAEDADFRFGGDAYAAGRSVNLSSSDVQDAFLAGDGVTLGADLSGSAHMAGRNVTIAGRVGQNLYAAGMNVDVAGAVAGNATVMGNDVQVDEPVSGNLRATASFVTLNAPVAGSAVLAGENVTLNETVVGDVALAAENITWGDGAVIEGTLHIYSDAPADIEVPARVIAESRIERHQMQAFEEVHGTRYTYEKPSAWEKLRGFLGGILVTGILASLLAVIAPRWVASLREASLEKPGYGLLMGLVGLSALFGFNIVLAMTGIGIFALFFTLPLTVAITLIGYLLGAYMVGVFALGTAGRAVPETFGDRVIAGFAGAAILGIVALVPLVGWWAALAATLLGLGGFVIHVFAPRFMGRF